MEKENFSDIGRVQAIERLYDGTPYSRGSAWFETAKGASVTTASRLLLEGTDFSLVYFPLKHLGYKSVVGVLGELYAEFVQPRALCIKLGISSKLDYSDIKELWSGVVAACVEHRIVHLDLDLVPSANGLIISVGASGETPSGTQRPKAESKDLLILSGSVGGAFLGMQVLERERRRFNKEGTQPNLDKYRMIVGNYLKPEIDPDVLSVFEQAGTIPSYGYLVNRGLSDAVKRLVRDSGLGAKIYAEQIPFEGNSFDLGKELGIDTVSAALNGGEDYRLLYCVPLEKFERVRHDLQTFNIIGHLAKSDVGAVLVTPDGVELPLRSQGWKDEE